MTREAYQAAKCQETKDREIVVTAEDHWQHVSQSVHHLHQHSHHAAHHTAGTEHHEPKPAHKTEQLTPEQARAKVNEIAEKQQFDETTGAMSHGFKNACDWTSNAFRGGYTGMRNGWDSFTDNFTSTTSWCPGDNARKHARELEQEERIENNVGHYQLADKLLTRDLQFSISTFGLTDKMTTELSNELRALHKQHKDLPRLPMINDI